MNRFASIFTVVMLSLSTVLMVALPIAVGYAIWGIGGAIALTIFAIAFWLYMGILLIRVRRAREGRADR